MTRARLRLLTRSALGGIIATTVAFALGTGAGCSGKTLSPGGLVVVFATDGTLPQATSLHVEVTSVDGLTSYLAPPPYALGGGVTLPKTLGIQPAAGVTSALVHASLWADATLLDDRQDIVVDIPTDRVAELDVVFSARCTRWALPEADGGAGSSCAAGTTCSPFDGTCQSNTVDASNLGTYPDDDATTGGQADAAPDSGLLVDGAPPPGTFVVAATVSGLAAGESVVLQDSAGKTVTVTANGPVTFLPQAFDAGFTDLVEVVSEPDGSAQQSCVVSYPPGAPQGSVPDMSMVAVTVDCSTTAVSVAGVVGSLFPGATVSVRAYVEPGDASDLLFTADASTSFQLNDRISTDGGGYLVTIAGQSNSPGLCAVYNASGTPSAPVTNVYVGCVPSTYSVVGSGSSAKHVCAVAPDTSVWCWGDNTYGQLGDSTQLPRVGAVRIPDYGWGSVAMGGDHTCAITTGKNLYCWGNDYSGQVGIDDSPGVVDKPAMVLSTATTWSSVALGASHTCGIQPSTNLFCWGDNSKGQLGINGFVTAANAPVSVPGKWTAVAAGANHTCGLQDTLLFCWGDNTYGQLGIANNTEQLEPVETPGNFVSISLGANHTCALDSESHLWCWGDNADGQLGDGTTTSQSLPEQIGTAQWATVSCGGNHTCGVQTQGTLLCWGDGSFGQLGNGSTSDLASPDAGVPVSNGATQSWTFPMATTATASFAFTGTSQTLYGWGDNDAGELGQPQPAGGGLSPVLVP